MEAADHLGFIAAAYAAAAAVVLALIAWVVLDYRVQRRALVVVHAVRSCRCRSAGRPHDSDERPAGGRERDSASRR